MHKQGKLWGLWLAPAIAALVVVTGAYPLANRSPAQDRKELSLGLEALRSQTAETGLLAEQARQGALTRRFVRDHARQLAKQVQASLDGIAKQGSKAQRPEVSEQAATLGRATLASLQRLADAPDSAATLDAVATTMAAASRELTRLDTTLGAP